MVFAVGETGAGKTVLAKQIAIDWGRNAQYLEHFRIVIFIDCMELKVGLDCCRAQYGPLHSPQ